MNAVGDLYHPAADNKKTPEILFSLADKSIEIVSCPVPEKHRLKKPAGRLPDDIFS